MRGILKSLVPPAARRWWRRRFGWRWFTGDYASWAMARGATAGYDDDRVLARVVAATRAVRTGAAAWERDGTTFAEPAVHAPLLAALRGIAAAEGGRLHVVDFGGALGSTWWQHRSALAELSVRWAVVEQPAFVSAGAEFADATLGFHRSLAEAQAATGASVCLISGVLQYVESPNRVLAEVAELGFRNVILDRTGFITGGRDRLAIQRTPPRLGGGSYPCWLFDRERLLAQLVADYEIVAEWPVPFDKVDVAVEYRGLHLRRRSPIPRVPVPTPP